MMIMRPPQQEQGWASGCAGSVWLVCGWGQVQELTHGLHRFGAIAAGEQAIVTDATETGAADRLTCRMIFVHRSSFTFGRTCRPPARRCAIGGISCSNASCSR